MFANANTKALLKDLKSTMKEPYVKKPTLGKIEFKVASIRKAQLKKEIMGRRDIKSTLNKNGKPPLA